MLTKDEAVEKMVSIFEEMHENKMVDSEIDAAIDEAKRWFKGNVEERRRLDEYFKTHSTQKSRGCIAK